MNEKRLFMIKNVFNYLVLCLILKNCNYLISINIDTVERIPLGFIPIGYLVIKYIFIKDLEKSNIQKEDVIKPIFIIYIIINLILQMPVYYDICTIIFLIILKDKISFNENETQKYIAEYYQKKKEEELSEKEK